MYMDISGSRITGEEEKTAFSTTSHHPSPSSMSWREKLQGWRDGVRGHRKVVARRGGYPAVEKVWPPGDQQLVVTVRTDKMGGVKENLSGCLVIMSSHFVPKKKVVDRRS